MIDMEQIDFKKVSEELWHLLDDIDTADDMCKSDEKRYRATVRNIIKKRWKMNNVLVESDGYKLKWSLPK
jgi:hypothetical protein